MSRSNLRRFLPALVGLAISVAVAVVFLTGGDSDRAAAPVGSAEPAARPEPAKVAPPANTPAGAPAEGEPVVETGDPDMQVRSDPPSNDNLPDWMTEEQKAEVRAERADWNPLTRDEMVEKSRPYLETMARREARLLEQIAAAEQAGDQDELARRRIDLERLRSRRAELEQALARNRLP